MESPAPHILCQHNGFSGRMIKFSSPAPTRLPFYGRLTGSVCDPGLLLYKLIQYFAPTPLKPDDKHQTEIPGSTSSHEQDS